MSDLLRERFEAWARGEGFSLEVELSCRTDGAVYKDHRLNIAKRAVEALAAAAPPPDRNDLLGGQGGRTSEAPATQRPELGGELKERCRAWVPGSKPGDPPPDCPPRRCAMNAGHEGRHFDGCQYFTPRQFDAPEQWRKP